jgi:VWFA-related protein
MDNWKEIDRNLTRSQMEELQKEAQLSLEDRILGNPEYIMWCLREEQKYFKRKRFGNSLSAFLAAINYIRKFEGVKSVLIVSDGIRIERDMVKLFDPFKIFGEKKYLSQREAFEKFLKLINEEKLIFYAFSPKGLKSEFSVNAPPYRLGKFFKEEIAQWSKELYSLEKITEETGGIYLKGQKKYKEFVRELGRDLTHFYDISYIPPQKPRKGGFHKIEVKVKKPGLIVRHKKGYFRFTNEELDKRNIASAFLAPSFYKDIKFSCRTDCVYLKGGYSQFWIRIQLPLGQFRDFENIISSEKLNLIFGISKKGEDKVHFGEIGLNIKKAIEKGINSVYYAVATSEVKLKPGKYDTRVILKNDKGQIGGWETSLKIHDVRKRTTLNIVNSIFGYLQKNEIENKIPFSISKRDGSLILTQYKFYPSVMNIFKKEGKIALFLQIYNPKEVRNFSLQFHLYKNGNDILNLPSQKIEALYDKKLEILNEVYLLDLKNIPEGEYQIKIKSPENFIEKSMNIKII